jgi:putative mRNA 3-end processing factor
MGGMSFYSLPLISWTPKGLYCEAGDFYIDPTRGVETAMVTHAHSDHARRGSQKYICVSSGINLLKTRLGKKIEVQGYAYGEIFRRGDVLVSFHSAGHILGSAQVRVQRGNEVWVASGDYKRESDPSCDPFESIACDVFITEATFGTPKFVWQKNENYGEQIANWWRENALTGRNSILFGYSLGKAQRILAEVAPYANGLHADYLALQKPILIHNSIQELTECYRQEGRVLAATRDLKLAIDEHAHPGKSLVGELVLAPPSILDESWVSALGDYRTAFASGWMNRFRASNAPNSGAISTYGGRYDHGFVMSDHADWEDLNRTIEETGAKQVYVQHRNGTLIRHLRKKGMDAHPVEALAPENFARLGGKNLELF